MIATSTRGDESGTSAFWSVAKGWGVRFLKGKSNEFKIMSTILHIRAIEETVFVKPVNARSDVPASLIILAGAARIYAYLTTQNPTIRASYIAVLHTATIDLHDLPSTFWPLPCVGAANTGAIARTFAKLLLVLVVRGGCVPVKYASHASPSTPFEASPAGFGIAQAFLGRPDHVDVRTVDTASGTTRTGSYERSRVKGPLGPTTGGNRTAITTAPITIHAPLGSMP